MAKYRIVKREYPNGYINYEAQKKVLGLFWWNFNYIDAHNTGLYETLEEAKKAIKIDKTTTKKNYYKH